MKQKFNLDLDMNSILQSDTVKTASLIEKKASYNPLSELVVKVSEMALELNNRGMTKTANSLKEAARSLVESSNDDQLKRLGQLYGLVK